MAELCLRNPYWTDDSKQHSLILTSQTLLMSSLLATTARWRARKRNVSKLISGSSCSNFFSLSIRRSEFSVWFALMTSWYSSTDTSNSRPSASCIINPPVLPYWYSYTAMSISARMSKITNDGLTRSGTGCFIAVPIWQQRASKG